MTTPETKVIDVQAHEIKMIDAQAPAIRSLTYGATSMLDEANRCAIDSADMAEVVSENLIEIKSAMKKASDFRLTITRPMDAAKQAVMDVFNPIIANYESAEKIMKQSLLAWNKKEAARLDAERAELARIAAEHSRQMRLAAQEEADRLEADAKEAEANANKMIDAGDIEGAAELLTIADESKAQAITTLTNTEHAAMTMQVMVPVSTAPRMSSGISVRAAHKATVTDLMALIKSIAAGESSIELVEANTKVIAARARALGMEFSAPGIHVYKEESIAASKSRRA